MKLESSQLLTQLSEQERNKVESELASLQLRKMRLEQSMADLSTRMRQLQAQRDQAIENNQPASMLQEFELSDREQQIRLEVMRQEMHAIEAEKKGILHRLAEAERTHQVYDKMHQNEKKRLDRKEEAKHQRQLDDMIASRPANRA